MQSSVLLPVALTSAEKLSAAVEDVEFRGILKSSTSPSRHMLKCSPKMFTMCGSPNPPEVSVGLGVGGTGVGAQLSQSSHSVQVHLVDHGCSLASHQWRQTEEHTEQPEQASVHVHLCPQSWALVAHHESQAAVSFNTFPCLVCATTSRARS